MLIKILISMIAAVTSSTLLKEPSPPSPQPSKLPPIKASAPSKPPSSPTKTAKKKVEVIRVFDASDHNNRTITQWRERGRLVKKDARPSGVILKSKVFLFVYKDTVSK